MSTELATEYADSVIAGIIADCDNGTPFGVSEDDDTEELSAYDYLEDVLDIQYIVNSDRTYRAARVLITCGGPNVWIDTDTNNLDVYWDGHVTRGLPREFVSALDDTLEELWDMGE